MRLMHRPYDEVVAMDIRVVTRHMQYRDIENQVKEMKQEKQRHAQPKR
jgi:hypothetical protein